MSRNFNIVFNLKFKEDKIVIFLEKLYGIFKNQHFRPLSSRFGKDEITLHDLDFKKLIPYIEEIKGKGATYVIHLDNGTILLSFLEKKNADKKYENIPRGTLSLDEDYILDEIGEWNDNHLEKCVSEIKEFCFALAKASNEELVLCDWDENLPDPNPSTYGISLLIIKKNLYKTFLREHIKFKFKVDLNEEQIEKLVKENAYSIEERGDFIIINFSAFRKEHQFYKAIEKLIEVRKNEQ